MLKMSIQLLDAISIFFCSIFGPGCSALVFNFKSFFPQPYWFMMFLLFRNVSVCVFQYNLFSQVPNFFWHFLCHVKFREPGFRLLCLMEYCSGMFSRSKRSNFFFGFERNFDYTFVTNSSWWELQSAPGLVLVWHDKIELLHFLHTRIKSICLINLSNKLFMN